MKTPMFLIVTGAFLLACGSSTNEETDHSAAPLSCEWVGTSADACRMRLERPTASALADVASLVTLLRETRATLDAECLAGIAELGIEWTDASSSCAEFGRYIAWGRGRLALDVQGADCTLAHMSSCGSEQPVCAEATVRVVRTDADEIYPDAKEITRQVADVVARRYATFVRTARLLEASQATIESAWSRLSDAAVPEPCLTTAASVLDDARFGLADELERATTVVAALETR